MIAPLHSAVCLLCGVSENFGFVSHFMSYPFSIGTIPLNWMNLPLSRWLSSTGLQRCDRRRPPALCPAGFRACSSTPSCARCFPGSAPRGWAPSRSVTHASLRRHRARCPDLAVYLFPPSSSPQEPVTSLMVISPPEPEPWIEDRSMPICSALRLAAFVALGSPDPSPPAACWPCPAA